MPHVMHVMTVPASLLFLSGQVAFMRERGYTVSIVSSPGPELDAFGAREGVRTYAIPMPRAITPRRDLESLARIVRVMRQLRPDIVHAHTPKGGLLGMMAATVAGVSGRIYHMRGLPMMTARGTRRAILTSTERVSCGLAKRVLCVSHSLREVAIAEHLVPSRKIEVLLGGSGNGVDSSGRFDPSKLPSDTRDRIRDALGIPRDAVVIGFVGRIVREKGIEELARAWASLRDKHPSVHLLLVGPFEPQDPISAEARAALEGDARVHFVPMTRDMPEHYAAMDIVVLPTHREGFPNVPLEAASMTLPVVATRIPGCIDAVRDGVTGMLVPPHDSEALKDALDAYLTDADLRRAHGESGRSRVERDFQRVRIWEGIDGVYRALLNEPGAHVTQAHAG